MTARQVTISGAPEGYDAKLLIDAVDRSGRPALFIGRDNKRVAAMRSALRYFSPETRILEFPAWDCPPYSRISPNIEIVARRLGALSELLDLERDGGFILLTTVNAAAQFVPARSWVESTRRTVAAGDGVSQESIINHLSGMGFVRAPVAVAQGEYAVRGSIVDVRSPSAPKPVRMDFFGDVLDGLRTYDPESQRTTGRLERVALAAVSEVVLDGDSISRFRGKYRAEFGNPKAGDMIYESVSKGTGFAGMEHWLPFFHDRLETVFDFAPHATVFEDDRVGELCEDRWRSVGELHLSRTEFGGRGFDSGDIGRAAQPELLFLDPATFGAIIESRDARRFRPGKLPTGLNVTDAGGRLGRNFAIERKQASRSLLEAFAEHVQELRKSMNVVVTCWSDGSRGRLQLILKDHGVADARLVESAEQLLAGGRSGVALAVWDLEQGFIAPGMAAISEQDVFGDRLGRSRKRPAHSTAFLAEARSLSRGELVVHAEHGIGRFIGLETIFISEAPHDCIALEYVGGDKLYLPVENMDILSRYGSGDAPLDRMGSSAWQERKARAKKKVLEIAGDLIRVAAERAVRSAPKLHSVDHSWESFLARFPYEETEDQDVAAAKVLEDLSSGSPMDRMICGDVGFGKTEIAMRAAFAAAMSGRQVALIAPTTLLVAQHFTTFTARFRSFPVTIGQLSRMVTGKADAETRSGIADGTIDIVIGTHALLSKSIEFKNLGLLIVDEEHSFGVRQKERLKELRTNVHVLTLTATPIPRSLQLALSGVKDLSIIATPPPDRHSIRTFVAEFDPVTIREALLREHFRRGQSFLVVPRIADLPQMEEFLSEHVPEVNFISAHGQLSAGALNSRTSAFFNGERDVLLSTTIVASGLDLPTANTIVIHRADRFGLAQLHQIRGRVGRSGLRAYAFLTYVRGTKLTDSAVRRLKVIESLDALGAGFSLAAHDLDIRGAGNLLGADQSGHVREVGVELYQSMLEDAVSRLKSGVGMESEESEEEWTPQLNLGLAVSIPEHYVPDIEVRMGLYRRMAALKKREELEGVAAELEDRFGPPPEEVSVLVKLLAVKALCRTANIARVDGGPKGATVEFRDDSFPNPKGLVKYVLAQDGRARIRGTKLVLRRNWRNAEAKLAGAAIIARDLSKLAAQPASEMPTEKRSADVPALN